MVSYLKTAVQWAKDLGKLRRKADTITGFSYQGSDTSFVAAGKSETILEPNGWVIEPLLSDKGRAVLVMIESTKTTENWNLEFAAPQGSVISTGRFKGAIHYPAQYPDEPGLSFSGCHRTNKKLTGEFTVLESVIENNRIIAFAADFVQYDGCQETSWNRGSIRFQSKMPLTVVPIPLVVPV